MSNPNRSLRLCEILEEEYTHMHQTANRSDLPEHAYIDIIDLLNEAELIARLNQWLYPAANKENKLPSPAEVRYQKLAKWLQKDGAKNPSPGASLDTPERIKKVLREKLNEPDLLKAEPWIQDTSLRPYTRGLLKGYHEQSNLSARVSKLFRRSSQHDQAPEPVDQKLLNRLLLEDAFTGYIERIDDKQLADVFKKIHDCHQTALCLSGGGIRSATFALGILQGLVKHEVLEKFTYLSTVSGGGYLGGWLSAWIHHEGFEKVNKDLRGQFGTPLEPEAVPVRHLRRYSNYLSPLLGLFSPDTWTLFAIYLRNLLLLWLVIIPLLAAVAAVPWVIVTLAEFDWQGASVGVPIAVGLSMLLTITGIGFVHAYRPRSKPVYEKEQPRYASRDQSAFLKKCLLPLSLAVLLWMLAWRWFEHLPSDAPKYLLFLRESLGLDENTGLTMNALGGWLIIIGSACVHFTGWLISLRYQSQHQQSYRWVEPVAVLITGGFAGFLLLLTAKLLRTGGTDSDIISYTCLGVPGFLLAVVLAGYAFEGFMSQLNEDAEREWSARHSAWLLIVAVGWLVMTGLVLWAPALVNEAIALIGLPTTAGVGVGSGILTALLGQSSRTTGEGEGAGASKSKTGKLSLSSLLSNLTLPVVATITVIALLIALSLFNLILIRWLSSALSTDYPAMSILDVSGYHVSKFVMVNPALPVIILGSLTIIGILIGLAVNTNKFSLHALYRARLIRAYLGASRPPGERQPDPFTGFDETDNLFMGCMRPPNPAARSSSDGDSKKTPFHIINIALNLVAGRNLAWQERMAESFTVSPLHAGAMYLGYRRTHLKGDTGCPSPVESPYYYGGKRGISLGTAMTISGAAASPNQGYHSSPVVAFLMTLFNVRLGWWLGNPGPAGDKTYNKSSPSLAIKPILDEMTGNTDDVNEYVYLSDGGHFENLGLYEMVLRRNRFILVSDAGCDETCTLEDLGNAIRKIRIDMGISIEFPYGFNIRARSDTANGPRAYWAIGRIGYSKIDAPQSASSDKDGILMYVKPGIIGDEPRDIFNYASSKKAFPHETTADQFFSESQFESYRALGAHVLERVQTDLKKEFGLSLSDFFKKDGWQTCLNALNKQRVKLAANGNGKLPHKLRGPMNVYVNEKGLTN